MLDTHLLHPKVVHFTVALLIMALLFEVLRLVTRKDMFGETARWNMIFGGLAAIVTFVTGLLAESHVVIAGAAKEVFERHETFGYITMILAVVLLIWHLAPGRLYRRFYSFYLIILAAVVVSLSMGAYNGGRLVYEFGVGVGMKSGAVEKPVIPDNPAGAGTSSSESN
ncbi:MAG: DUF2231 domain-containing protein [candidate division Zixibacteria bacterium]|nr:DUF2231 domain-containing protein [candidate division Zixibacteria bacterium]